MDLNLLFFRDLRGVFADLRIKLEQCGKGHMAENVISGSIFLRYLCPAILTPSLFELTKNGGKDNRYIEF